jgi:pimeloyl-ACP methyl ester carboxylesterase
MFLDPIKKMIKDVQTAALMVVAECGHVVNIEKAQEFNERVIEYLLSFKENKLNFSGQPV